MNQQTEIPQEVSALSQAIVRLVDYLQQKFELTDSQATGMAAGIIRSFPNMVELTPEVEVDFWKIAQQIKSQPDLTNN